MALVKVDPVLKRNRSCVLWAIGRSSMVLLMANSLVRTAEALDCLAENPKGLSVTELAQVMRASKSTASRLLAALVQSGLVAKADAQKHVLDLRFWTWGVQASRRLAVLDVARPHIAAAARETTSRVYIAVVRGYDTIYLESATSTPRGETVVSPVAHTFPVYACAPGKAILAFSSNEDVETVLNGPLIKFTPQTLATRQELEEEISSVRRQGYAINRGEYYDNGHLAAAVPIFDETASPVASVCFSRLGDEQNLNSLVSPLLDVGATISASLGYNTAIRELVG
jgi:IclR family transcriptional regulator, KDG regulon repressor